MVGFRGLKILGIIIRLHHQKPISRNQKEEEQLIINGEYYVFHFMKVEDFYMGEWHKAESLMIPDARARKINNGHPEKSKVSAGKEAIRIAR